MLAINNLALNARCAHFFAPRRLKMSDQPSLVTVCWYTNLPLLQPVGPTHVTFNLEYLPEQVRTKMIEWLAEWRWMTDEGDHAMVSPYNGPEFYFLHLLFCVKALHDLGHIDDASFPNCDGTVPPGYDHKKLEILSGLFLGRQCKQYCTVDELFNMFSSNDIDIIPPAVRTVMQDDAMFPINRPLEFVGALRAILEAHDLMPEQIAEDAIVMRSLLHPLGWGNLRAPDGSLQVCYG